MAKKKCKCDTLKIIGKSHRPLKKKKKKMHRNVLKLNTLDSHL